VNTGGGLTGDKPQSLNIFSADYYIMKPPADGDYAKLQHFMTVDDKAVADGAALVLGYYYLRDRNLIEARPLLENYTKSSNIEPWLGIMGQLWLMELAIANENFEGAALEADKVKPTLKEQATQDALGMYCTIMKITPDADSEDGAYSCVTKRLGSFGLGENSAGFSLEPISGDLNILITGTGNMLDKAGGIYYYMRKHNLRHKIKVSQTYIEGDWDFWLDMDKGYLNGKGVNILFKPDLGFYISRLPYFVQMEGCRNVVLGVTSRNRRAAEDLKLTLEAQNEPPKVSIIDISGIDAMRQVRYVVSGLVNRPYCAFGIGSEEEINNFMPSVRNYRNRPLTQPIYSIMPIDTGAHYVDPYLQYYRNSFVYPMVDLSLTPEGAAFAAEYKQWAGKDPILEVFVSYDMMHFININTNEGKGYSTEPYVSNIKLFSAGQAVRELRLFRIASTGAVETVEQEFDENVYRADPPEAPAMGIGVE
jgi:hypothetical protein